MHPKKIPIYFSIFLLTIVIGIFASTPLYATSSAPSQPQSFFSQVGDELSSVGAFATQALGTSIAVPARLSFSLPAFSLPALPSFGSITHNIVCFFSSCTTAPASTPTPPHSAPLSPTPPPPTSPTPTAHITPAPAPARRVVAPVITTTQPTVIQRTVTQVLSGVTEATLDQKIADLNQQLLSQIQDIRNQNSSNFNSIALSQRINSLSSPTISSPTITGGSITASSITGDINLGAGTFSGNLSAGGQLTVSGTATSTIAGDTNFDSGTLYVNSLNNRVGVGTSSPTDTLSVAGPIFLSDNSPSVTTNRLYSTAGSLYWNGTAVGSGGGGTSSWATTTSQVTGRLINHSLNNTDIVAIGGSATTSAPFWFDPNTTTGYFSGKVGIGTTSPYAALSVVGASDLGNSATAGYFNATSTTATSTLRDVNIAGGDGSHIFWGGTRFIAAPSGDQSTFIGLGAGPSIFGVNNHLTATGYQSLSSNLNGYDIVAVGYQSLYSNTDGWFNTAMGSRAAYSNTTGYDITALGYHALYSNVSGYDTTAVGNQALYSNTTAPDNVAVGNKTLYSNTTGYMNTAVGNKGLYSNVTGYENVSLGRKALYSNLTGASSTAIGANAGYNNTGNANTFFGANAGYTDGTVTTPGTITNATAIGYNAQVSASNSFILGGTGAYGVNVGIGTTSPWRALSVNGSSDLGINALAGYFTATSTTAASSIAYRLGIGTTSPAYPLEVSTPGGGGFGFAQTNGTHTVASYVDSTGGWLGTPTNDPLYLYTNNSSPYLTMTTSGTVAIGDNYTTPGAQLDVKAVGTQLRLTYFLGTQYVNFNTSSGGSLNIASSGGAPNPLTFTGFSNVGIGTTSPTGNLTLQGTAGQTANLFTLASSTGASVFSIGPFGNTTINNGTITSGAGLATLSVSTTRTVGNGIADPSSPVQNLNAFMTANPSSNDGDYYGNLLKTKFSGTISESGGIVGATNYAFTTAGSGVVVTDIIGAYNFGQANGMGGATNVYGSKNTAAGYIGGTVTNAYAVYANIYGLAGNSITNGYGVYVASSGASNVVNPYGVYVQSDKSYFGGNVGVGSTTPWAQLSVNPNGQTGPSFAVGSSTATNFVVTNGGFVGVGTTSPETNFTVVGAICAARGAGVQTTACGTTAGAIYANSSSLTGGYDVAETYPTTDSSLVAGDIVALDPAHPGSVVKASSNAPALFGIISTSPGLTLGVSSSSTVPVALSGRIPVKVTNEGGAINVGDHITLSPTQPGVGIKATTSSQTLGIALEPYDSSAVGLIQVFANLTYTHLDPKVTTLTDPKSAFWSTDESSGRIKFITPLDLNGFDIIGVSAIQGAASKWSIDANGILQVGEVHANKVCIGSTCVDEPLLKKILNTLGGGATATTDTASTPPPTPSPTPTTDTTSTTTPSTTQTTTTSTTTASSDTTSTTTPTTTQSEPSHVTSTPTDTSTTTPATTTTSTAPSSPSSDTTSSTTSTQTTETASTTTP